MLKKVTLIFLSLLLVLSSSLLVPAATLAQDSGQDINNLWNHKWYSEQNPFEWYNKVYNSNTSPDSEIFGERYTAAQVQWVIYALWAHLWNFIPGNPELTTCLVGGDANQCFEIFKKGMDLLNPIGDSGQSNLASIVGHNPVSGVHYFNNLIRKFSVVKEAQAQGFGYTSAAGAIQNLWAATRNISFGLMIVVVIVIAFMIMFRVKISPQVVISVQSAIPKIIVSLVLITFSYAIAGLAIDLMYVVIGLLATLLTTSGLTNHDAIFMFKELTTNHSAFSIMYQYWLAFVWSALVTIFTSGSDFFLGILVFLFAILSIVAIILWSIKIIFFIFKNFAMVILTIAMGPLEILLGTVINSMGFGSWFKKLLSHLAVYPVMGLMLFLAFFFLVQGGVENADAYAETFPFNPKQSEITGNEWRPPFSFFQFGLGGPAGGDKILWVIVSFVVFSQITKVAEIIQASIAGKPFEYGTAIGEATKLGGAYGLYAAGTLGQGTGFWPFPFNYVPGLRSREVPEWLNKLADSIKRPLETVGGVARGGR